MFKTLKKRINKLERGFDFLINQNENGRLRYTTYQQNGRKYLVLTKFADEGVQWSKHFIVESIAEDRGINPDAIDNEALFRNISPL